MIPHLLQPQHENDMVKGTTFFIQNSVMFRMVFGAILVYNTVVALSTDRAGLLIFEKSWWFKGCAFAELSLFGCEGKKKSNKQERIMDELIKLVSQKTGLPEATARKAVETVMEFLKERIPEPLGSQLEGLLDGSGGLDLDSLGDIASGLGDLFGGK